MCKKKNIYNYENNHICIQTNWKVSSGMKIHQHKTSRNSYFWCIRLRCSKNLQIHQNIQFSIWFHSGIVAEKLGRKMGLLFSNIFIILAAICTATAKPTSSIELIIISRFLTGLNAGLNAGITPMYLAEISPTNLRGAVGSVYQLVITISILVSQILGIRSVFGNEDSWPILLTLILIPCVFQVSITFFKLY